MLRIDNVDYFLGCASGDGFNCLIYSLLQCAGLGVANVDAVRRDLMAEFRSPCGPCCGSSGSTCERTCTKVYPCNFLSTDHWDAVLRLLGKHRLQGAIQLDTSLYCVRVLELNWENNGVVLGNPQAPRRLTIARENGNHFIPVLRRHSSAPICSPW